MRRFYVYSPAWLKGYDSLWADCGFLPVTELSSCGTEPPDVYLVCGEPEDSAAFWQSAKVIRSKVIVIAAKSAQLVPADARDIYEEQSISGDSLFFTLATRLEGDIPVPVWDMYRSDGQLNEALEHKVIADTLYRYLLKDVMRETFEWCGHTFSVLGPA